jgi:hypothetical protein
VPICLAELVEQGRFSSSLHRSVVARAVARLVAGADRLLATGLQPSYGEPQRTRSEIPAQVALLLQQLLHLQ